jgi:hypothetical protein
VPLLLLGSCIGTIDAVYRHRPTNLEPFSESLWVAPVEPGVSILVPQFLYMKAQHSEDLDFRLVGPRSSEAEIRSAELTASGRSYPAAIREWERSFRYSSQEQLFGGETLPLRVITAEWSFAEPVGDILRGDVEVVLQVRVAESDRLLSLTFRRPRLWRWSTRPNKALQLTARRASALSPRSPAARR